MDANTVEFVFLTTILTFCLKSFKIFQNSPSTGSRTQTCGTLGQSANHYTKLFCQSEGCKDCAQQSMSGFRQQPNVTC